MLGSRRAVWLASAPTSCTAAPHRRPACPSLFRQAAAPRPPHAAWLCWLPSARSGCRTMPQQWAPIACAACAICRCVGRDSDLVLPTRCWFAQRLLQEQCRQGACVPAPQSHSPLVLYSAQERHPDVIGDVRGEGLMIGIEIIADPGSKVSAPVLGTGGTSCMRCRRTHARGCKLDATRKVQQALQYPGRLPLQEVRLPAFTCPLSPPSSPSLHRLTRPRWRATSSCAARRSTGCCSALRAPTPQSSRWVCAARMPCLLPGLCGAANWTCSSALFQLTGGMCVP